jgi:heat shock protein HslJ
MTVKIFSKEIFVMPKKCLKIALSVAFLALILVASRPASAAEPVDDELFAWQGGEIHRLHRVDDVFGDGTQLYESLDDSGTFFKSSGGEAELSVRGRKYSRYTLIRETEDEDEIIFTADGVNYVMKQVVSASGAKYEALGDPDTYFWSRGAFATLVIRGEEYADYVAWLPSGGILIMDEGIPADVEWKIKSISGVNVADGSTLTITFHPDGTLSGNASVNNYRATWITSGGRMIVRGGSSTMKIGPEELMRQERAYLDALSAIVGFKFGRDGPILITRDGLEVVLTKRLRQ